MIIPEFVPTVKSLISRKWNIPEGDLRVIMHYMTYHDEIAIIIVPGTFTDTGVDAVIVCECERENGTWCISKHDFTDGIYTDDNQVEKEYNEDGTLKEQV